jgi:hypothetical protein
MFDLQPPRHISTPRVSPVAPRSGDGLLTEPIAGARPGHQELVFMLRVFGRLPDTGVSECTEAGVGKASREETAGELSPAVVSVYGDLAAAFDLIWGLRTRAPAAPVARCCGWSPWAGSGGRCRAERCAIWRPKWALTVAIGGAWRLPAGYRPRPSGVMWAGGKSVLVMSCRARAMGWARAKARGQVRKSGR